ncbi:hypothetical protein [Chamaesiphon minutus]|uniref:hypothetical protein n=1 Tax=Chamaesiphon minutus TaxID=1173032 RepID=UPI0012F775D2|nr:hypothetical protein [Chamaesiphon minutus]
MNNPFITGLPTVIRRQRHWRVATAIDSDIFTDRYLSRQVPIDRQIYSQIGV